MGAILDQRNEADLRKSARTAAASRTTESSIIHRFVGNIQRAAVQTDEPIAKLHRPAEFFGEMR
jgi:hypothetical protein